MKNEELSNPNEVGAGMNAARLTRAKMEEDRDIRAIRMECLKLAVATGYPTVAGAKEFEAYILGADVSK